MSVRSLALAVALAMFAAHGIAQSQTPAGTRLTFEVASIKRNVSGDPGASIRVQPGGQITVTNNSLYNLIRNAYNTQRFEMVPGAKLPSWIDSDRWDINAKGSETATQPEVITRRVTPQLYWVTPYPNIPQAGGSQQEGGLRGNPGDVVVIVRPFGGENVEGEKP